MIVSRDVYGKHYDELTEKQRKYLRELVALALLEQEELEASSKK